MELSWSLLLLVIAMGLFAAFWHDALGARDAANAVAREACESTGAALLNGTVSFQALRLVRDQGGWLVFERTYVFDYSNDGVSVRQGFVVVCGRRVESVGLQ